MFLLVHCAAKCCSYTWTPLQVSDTTTCTLSHEPCGCVGPETGLDSRNELLLVGTYRQSMGIHAWRGTNQS